MQQEYSISKDKTKLQMDKIKKLMEQTYWAPNRSMEICLSAIQNSMCFGVYDAYDIQVGFARVITDYATTFYICDVIIDKEHRGKELGKSLIKYITEDLEIKDLYGILVTSDAHGLYRHFGFEEEMKNFMHKKRKQI